MPDREKILRIAREEMKKHFFDTFVDQPPSIVRGGKGVVVSGCPMCKKRLQSLQQFMQHISDDFLPVIVDKVTAE
jgi:hypothetical protein